jgi:ribosomal protein L11 methyltransferase
VGAERKEYIEVSLAVPPELQESLSSFLIGIGASGTWIDGEKVKSFFNLSTVSEKEIEARMAPFFLRFKEEGVQIPSETLSIRKNASEDWNSEWKKFFKPIQVTPRLIVSPPWEKIDKVRPEQKVVWIDPGFGFGTGTHPTTKNCLVLLDQILAAHPDPAQLKLLDVGSGSGVLAIAAAKLGVGEILAAEIDGDAIESMRHNFMINQVIHQVRLRLGSIFQADRNSYHLVLANLTAEDLIRISRDLQRAILQGGSAILSGILVEKKEAVEKTFGELNLQKVGEIIEDKWVTQVWRKG